MMGSRRRDAFVAAVLAATVLAPLAAWAQAAECVGVEIQPARLEHDLERAHTYDAVVRNCTDETLDVTVSVAGLGHDLDGAPEFYDSSSAERSLRVAGAGAFTLKAGKAKRFQATAQIPSGDRSLYAGIVAEFERPGQTAATSVATRTRVAGMLLMRGPKPWKETAKVIDVGLTPGANGSYVVHAAVEDTGNVHISPTGTVEISQDGEVLDVVKLTGGTILPGFRRRLTGTWTPAGDLNGRVRLTAHISGPAATGVGEFDFTDGEAAVPAARITQLVATDDDGTAYLEVTLQNVGSVAISPNVEMVVREEDVERARMNFPQTQPMAPGETRTVQWTPALTDGTYFVTARAMLDGELLDEKVTGLRMGVAPRAGAGEGGKLTVVLVAAGVLVCVAAGLLLLVVAKRRRRDDDQPKEPPAAERKKSPAAARKEQAGSESELVGSGSGRRRT